jgi:hypothetical protein
MTDDIQAAIKKLVEFGLVADENQLQGGIQGGRGSELIEFEELKLTGYDDIYSLFARDGRWLVEQPRLGAGIALFADNLDEGVQIVCDLYTGVPPFEDDVFNQLARALSVANIYVTRENGVTHEILGNKIGKPVSADEGFSIAKRGKFFALWIWDRHWTQNPFVKGTRDINEIIEYLISNL